MPVQENNESQQNSGRSDSRSTDYGRSPASNNTTTSMAAGPHAALALDPGVGKLVPKRVNRLEREIAPVDLDNDAGLGVVDDELAVFHIKTQWRHAAHPHALFLGRGDLVADPFAGDFAH
jgi:hypothetical protein